MRERPVELIGAAVLLVLATSLGAPAVAAPATVERSAKVRSGPGAGYHILATLPRGATVDVTGCRGGWCEVAWRGGGRGYIGQGLLALVGAPAVAPPVPGAAYDYYDYDYAYEYPGFDYPGIAYGPTFGVTVGPRWSHRRWSRWHHRPGAWAARSFSPPGGTAPQARSPERSVVRGTPAAPNPTVGGHPGAARPTVGSTPTPVAPVAPVEAFGGRPTVGNTPADSARAAPAPALSAAPAAAPVSGAVAPAVPALGERR